MSATQPITEQCLLTAQDSLSKWAVLRFETAKLHNLSQSVTDRLTFVDSLQIELQLVTSTLDVCHKYVIIKSQMGIVIQKW